jgi:hypothetical protein
MFQSQTFSKSSGGQDELVISFDAEPGQASESIMPAQNTACFCVRI